MENSIFKQPIVFTTNQNLTTRNYSQIVLKEKTASSYARFFKSAILKCSKAMLAFLFTLFFAGNLLAQSGDFVTKWDLATTTGSGTNQLSFGTATSNTVSYSWTEVGGSGTGSGTFSGSTLTITGLPTGATIRLRISPTNFQQIKINNGTDKSRLLDVEQWGTTAWTSMNTAFKGCSNLNITATDVPNLSSVTDMYGMFTSCAKLNGPSNINSWNTSTVTNMYDLFDGCSIFNQNIGSWNTENVTTFHQMFRRAYAFNQNIGNWNTAKVTNMAQTFHAAVAFNQNLSNWTLNANVNMSNMLSSCGMDCNNYSATLIGWSQNTNTPNNLTLGASGLKYGSYATTDRTNLDDTKNWTITDGGQGTCTDGSLVQMIDFGGFIKHDVTNLDKPLNVYPNPATDLINLEFNGIAPSTFNVLVMDMSGKVIIKLNGVHAESNQYTLPLNGIVSGMYVVKLSDELGNTTINRFNIK